jgi:hypothetical protein
MQGIRDSVTPEEYARLSADPALSYWNSILWYDGDSQEKAQFIAATAKGEEILKTAKLVETIRYAVANQGEEYRHAEEPVDSPWVEYPAGYIATSPRYRSCALRLTNADSAQASQ